MRCQSRFSVWLTVGTLFIESLTGCSQPQEAVTVAPASSLRPNILVFVADDMGWNDIGYRNPEILTPNLDGLAEAGVRLESFYVFPTCSPTRAAFMTGRCPSRYGIEGPFAGQGSVELKPQGQEQALPRDVVTLPARLRDIGYQTALIGKWHLGLNPDVGPRKYGFDYSYGYFHGQVDPFTHLYKTGARTWHRNDTYVDEEGHVTDLLTREAISYLEKPTDHPFFLYVAYSVPHFPLNEPERWVEPYAKNIPNVSRRHFAASVTHMDDSIGQIVAALERTGQRDQTLIVFFSDNGGQESWSSKTEYDGRYPPHDVLGDNRPLRGWKADLYEGGIRVPAFLNWPKQLRAGIRNNVCSVLDMLPTLINVAGGKAVSSKDAPLEGMNIWSTISTDEKAPARTLYWKTPDQLALRMGDWKLVQGRKSGTNELFNLAEDPFEKKDLAGAEPERVRQMLVELAKQQAGDPSPAK